MDFGGELLAEQQHVRAPSGHRARDLLDQPPPQRLQADGVRLRDSRLLRPARDRRPTWERCRAIDGWARHGGPMTNGSLWVPSTVVSRPETSNGMHRWVRRCLRTPSCSQRRRRPSANQQQQTAATNARSGGFECIYSRLARRKRRSMTPTPPLCKQGVRGSSPLGSSPSQSGLAHAW